VSSMQPAGLHDVYFFTLNMAQSKKDDPGQIPFYARLFSDSSRRSMGGAASFRRSPSPLPLAVHLPRCLLRCLLTATGCPSKVVSRSPLRSLSVSATSPSPEIGP